MLDIKQFNKGIKAFVGDDVGEEGRPCLQLPNQAQVYAYVHEGDKDSDGLPYLNVSVHLDGDGWPPELTYDDDCVSMVVTVEATEVFVALPNAVPTFTYVGDWYDAAGGESFVATVTALDEPSARAALAAHLAQEISDDHPAEQIFGDDAQAFLIAVFEGAPPLLDNYPGNRSEQSRITIDTTKEN